MVGMRQFDPVVRGDADCGDIRVEGRAEFGLDGGDALQPGDLSFPGDVASLAEPHLLGTSGGKPKGHSECQQNQDWSPHYLCSRWDFNCSAIVSPTSCMCSCISSRSWCRR